MTICIAQVYNIMFNTNDQASKQCCVKGIVHDPMRSIWVRLVQHGANDENITNIVQLFLTKTNSENPIITISYSSRNIMDIRKIVVIQSDVN